MRRFSAFVLLAGCSQILGVGDFHTSGNGPSDGNTTGDGGNTGDGGGTTDGNNVTPPPPDGPPVSCAQVSTQTNTCNLPAGTAVHITSDSAFNTSTGILTRNSDGMTIVVTVSNVAGPVVPIETIVATTFEIDSGATLRVSGSAAFGVIATDTITIGGVIDASAGGAGATNPPSFLCKPGASGNVNNGYGGGTGGAGAQGSGGGGGYSDFDAQLALGGSGGASRGIDEAPLGGCTNGGGAVYLASATGLVISAGGGINVGGGGGKAAAASSSGGGGGGGAGGTIMLETPGLVMDGILASNGGGGGEGGSFDSPGSGQAGQLSAKGASGGSGGFYATGGTGGAGSALAGGGGNINTSGGGGGGGGGVGYIIIHANTQSGSGVFSPAQSD
jgi:hypothetical protein